MMSQHGGLATEVFSQQVEEELNPLLSVNSANN